MAHSSQVAKGLIEVLPAAQLVQASPLPADIVPAVHSIQEVKGLMDALPAAQSAQVSPPDEDLPASQSTHEVKGVIEL